MKFCFVALVRRYNIDAKLKWFYIIFLTLRPFCIYNVVKLYARLIKDLYVFNIIKILNTSVVYIAL